MCFVEPGIVLQLGNGDIVAFDSAALSHFNEQFSGFRASLVFHSDKESLEWINSRNHWQDNLHFHST